MELTIKSDTDLQPVLKQLICGTMYINLCDISTYTQMLQNTQTHSFELRLAFNDSYVHVFQA